MKLRRLLAIGAALAALGSAPALAERVQTVQGAQTPVGPSQFGVTVATSTALTVPGGATVAYITVEGQAIRWADDGTTPTATVGNLVQPGQFVYFGNLSALRIIQTAPTATIDVAYYK